MKERMKEQKKNLQSAAQNSGSGSSPSNLTKQRIQYLHNSLWPWNQMKWSVAKKEISTSHQIIWSWQQMYSRLHMSHLCLCITLVLWFYYVELFKLLWCSCRGCCWRKAGRITVTNYTDNEHNSWCWWNIRYQYYSAEIPAAWLSAPELWHIAHTRCQCW